ncbi:NACHT domain-containing protein [Kiloniella litopenaei]|uniref:NACHT domain-containing protein n=1 Tax=Kiloniella litopenaei TaxID=1549748 RepID=UPI003BACC83C
MPLDWSSFEKLPGDSRINFENLCRGIVHIHWAQYGQFTAQKNQPGVEFHILLKKDCSELGNTARWYGWQCKKFDRTKSGSLTAASKNQIKDSLDKTVTHLPKLTDWVLWTPYTLSKSDQDWFKSLDSKYPYSLHLWADEEIETYLVGPALMLRGTYFGELVITPDNLKARHDESIAPIKDRWINPVHQETDVERTIRRMLGEPDYWQDMVALGQRLSIAASTIEAWKCTGPKLLNLQTSFVKACSIFSEMLLQFHKILSEGDIDVIQQWLSNRKSLIDSDVISFPRFLRKQNIAITLEVINALDDMRIAQRLYDEVEEYLSVGMVAVLADAGGGKTHLAAELSSEQENRPAGILLHGRNFYRGQNQHDLARQFLVNGTPLDSMEKMLASLDAAAKRARCILPLVIDGLNEAENPKEWKDTLSYIQASVINYPNVLVICTLRTGEYKRPYLSRHETETRETFAVQSLPDDIWQFECEGFGEDVHDAIGKYFEYYKIACENGVEIPAGFLNHPLNLRIFCDVINPKREEVVEINYFPASLAHLFDEYLQNTCNRIATMKNFNYSSQDIKNAIYQFGISLWESKGREIDEKSYRDLISDSARNWNKSVINLFAQEGIIFRNPAQEPGKYVITPVYDALGGHIIADALLKKYSQDRSFEWLNTPSVFSNFGGESSHSLAYDIFKSLVALVPSRMYGEQLWKNVPEPYKQRALLHASELNAEHLDKETVDELASLINKKSEKVRNIFSRLWLTKGALKHPLNADFLDSVLWNMSVDERDLSWTEWVRHEQRRDKKGLIPELSLLEAKWKCDRTYRSNSDRLRAQAIKWLLTSTDHPLRNTATKALYWYGRGDPEFLFNETIKSFKINDPYIPERMLAASYGVGMSLSAQLPNNPSFTSGTLLKFAGSVFDIMFKDTAKYYTTHYFMRDFASKIIELAQYHNPNFFSDSDIKRTVPPFSVDIAKNWEERYFLEEAGISNHIANVFNFILGKKLHRKLDELLPEKWKDKAMSKRISLRKQSPFLMDFENYTIGRLVPDRRNYDYDHKEYQKVRAQLQWRVEQLGWSHEKFGKIEEAIQNWQGFERRTSEKLKTDRYGKKYSWIAYYEMYGLLKDKGIIDEYDWRRLDTQNVDPSFSEPLLPQTLIKTNFLGDDKTTTPTWIKDDDLPDMEPYLKLQKIGSKKGPWIALDGYINQENKDLKRETSLLIRSFIVPTKEKDEILNFLNKQDISGGWLPEKFNFPQTFFAEIPWSSAFPCNSTYDLSFVIKETIITRQRPKVEIVRNDQSISFITHDEMEEYEDVERKYKTFKVIMPVCNLEQNVTDNEVGHVSSLTKKLTANMELIGQPQSFDLHTKNGKTASQYIVHNEKEYKNNHSVYYLREDVLDSFMKKNEMSLIWVILGEKNYSYSWSHRRDDNFPEQLNKAFCIVKDYDINA